MSAAILCPVCDQEPYFRWTDAHGVAICGRCGLAYRLYHYEGDKRLEKPPEVLLKAEWIPLARKYYAETKRKVYPGAFDCGFLGHRECTYSGATEEDFAAWDEWLKKHEGECPTKAEVQS